MNYLQFSLFKYGWTNLFGIRQKTVTPLPVALAPINKGGEAVALAQKGLVATQPRIINIREVHSCDLGFETPDTQKDYVVKSQLTVIQALRKHPGCPVMVQSLDEDLEYRPCEPAMRARLLFRNGIPSTLEELTYPQREFIYEFGGAHLLFYLREIPVLHKTVRNERENRSKTQLPRMCA